MATILHFPKRTNINTASAIYAALKRIEAEQPLLSADPDFRAMVNRKHAELMRIARIAG